MPTACGRRGGELLLRVPRGGLCKTQSHLHPGLCPKKGLRFFLKKERVEKIALFYIQVPRCWVRNQESPSLVGASASSQEGLLHYYLPLIHFDFFAPVPEPSASPPRRPPPLSVCHELAAGQRHWGGGLLGCCAVVGAVVVARAGRRLHLGAGHQRLRGSRRSHGQWDLHCGPRPDHCWWRATPSCACVGKQESVAVCLRL